MSGPKKKVALVYNGELGIAAKDILDVFDFEYLELPRSIDNFRRAEDYFPEEWCFDIKLMYADLLEAVNRGADIVICITSGIVSFLGPCRLPHVADQQIEEKLKKFTGKNFQYIKLKFFPQVIFLSMLRKFKKLGINIYNPVNFLKLLRALRLVKTKLKVLHEAKDLMRRARAKEKEKGQSFKLYKEFEQKVKNVKSRALAERLFSDFQQELQQVEQEEKKVLKIGLVGDFYALLWDFPIFDLENYICRLFDVEILPTYSIYDLYFSRRWQTKKEVNKKFSRYMSYWAGGSDTITVRGYIELMDEYQADGIVQLRTFGCIPEEVSSLAIQKINEKEKNPPAFMILSFDDHSNPEGIKTRLEAFCNTLIRKKSQCPNPKYQISSKLQISND